MTTPLVDGDETTDDRVTVFTRESDTVKSGAFWQTCDPVMPHCAGGRWSVPEGARSLPQPASSSRQNANLEKYMRDS